MLAFCRALESMAFCEGSFRSRLLGDEVLSVLLFNPWDRLLWWPRTNGGDDALSVCGIVASTSLASLGRVDSGLPRAEVDKYEVSCAARYSSPRRPVLLPVLGCDVESAARPKSSWSRDGRGNMGGSVARGGIED